MRRRQLFASAAATAWPHILAAQQPVERPRRIGVLMDLASTDKEGQARLDALRAELRRAGWIDGENARIDVRWAAGNADLTRQHADELIALRPDVIVAAGSSSLAPLHKATSTLPIVFVTVIDPVGAGFVASEARPGGNITGFTALDYSIGAKWVQLLLELRPTLKRMVVLHDTSLSSGRSQLGAIAAVARPRGVSLAPLGLRDAEEIRRGLEENAAQGDCGVIVTSNTQAIVHRDLIISLAAMHRLPGGLLAPALRDRRRADRLQPRPRRPVSSGRHLREQNTEGREAREPAGPVADQVRAGDQPPDRPVARHRPPRNADGAGRRSRGVKPLSGTPRFP